MRLGTQRPSSGSCSAALWPAVPPRLVASTRRRAPRSSNSSTFFVPYLERGMRVLDCGCGAGSMTLELATRVAPGEVVGLDLESRVLEQAHASAVAQGIDSVRFEQGDAYTIPYSDGTFDVVFSHSLVAHLAEPVRALREIRRVLKPSGLAAVIDNDPGTYVVCPSGSAMKRFWDLFTRRQRYNGGLQLLPRNLRGALLEAGFAVAEAHTPATPSVRHSSLPKARRVRSVRPSSGRRLASRAGDCFRSQSPDGGTGFSEAFPHHFPHKCVEFHKDRRIRASTVCARLAAHGCAPSQSWEEIESVLPLDSRQVSGLQKRVGEQCVDQALDVRLRQCRPVTPEEQL
jgi:SAM-dependent methyltransferase